MLGSGMHVCVGVCCVPMEVCHVGSVMRVMVQASTWAPQAREGISRSGRGGSGE
jgi:hypothetical protein